MPIGDWRSHCKYLGVAIALAIQLAPAQAECFTVYDDKACYAHCDQEQAQAVTLLADNEGSADEYEPECDQPKSQREADLCAQVRMAEASDALVNQAWYQFRATLGEIGLLVIAIIIASWAAWEARRAARAGYETVETTRKIGEAQVRAYVSWSGANMSPLGDEDGRIVSFMFRPTIQNTGQSPAKLAALFSYSQLIDGERAPTCRFDIEKASCFDEIGASNKFVLAPQSISFETAVDVYKGRKRFYILGWAAYRDVFQTETEPPHTFAFCFEVLFAGDPRVFTRDTNFGANVRYHSRPDFIIEPEQQS